MATELAQDETILSEHDQQKNDGEPGADEHRETPKADLQTLRRRNVDADLFENHAAVGQDDGEQLKILRRY